MTHSLIQKQFGDNALKYATSQVHRSPASLERLVELVQPRSSWQVLDIATGAGHTALAFAPLVDLVIASDVTGPMLALVNQLTRERGIKNLTTEVADAQDLPFAAERFDLVTCRLAPHHFTDISAFLRAVHQVLKPQGTFALVDNMSPDDKSCPGWSAAEILNGLKAYNEFEKLRDPSHVYALTLAQWQTAIEKAGLTPTHVGTQQKDMEFSSWVERMSVNDETAKLLRSMLTDGDRVAKAFLKPKMHEGELWFTLTECELIAVKAT